MAIQIILALSDLFQSDHNKSAPNKVDAAIRIQLIATLLAAPSKSLTGFFDGAAGAATSAQVLLTAGFALTASTGFSGITEMVVGMAGTSDHEIDADEVGFAGSGASDQVLAGSTGLLVVLLLGSGTSDQCLSSDDVGLMGLLVVVLMTTLDQVGSYFEVGSACLLVVVLMSTLDQVGSYLDVGSTCLLVVVLMSTLDQVGSYVLVDVGSTCLLVVVLMSTLDQVGSYSLVLELVVDHVRV